MSEEIVCDPAAQDGAGVRRPATGSLVPKCKCSRVPSGTNLKSRTQPLEIQIVIPGERAVAEIVYRTPEGSVRRQAVSERQILIIPAGQPISCSCARGTDLTVVRIASDLLRRIARESGMRAVEVVGSTVPSIRYLALGRAVRAELRRHRQLDGTYLHCVAVVLTRHLLSTYVTAVLPHENGDCLASSCDVRSSTYTSTWQATSAFAMSPLMCG